MRKLQRLGTLAALLVALTGCGRGRAATRHEIAQTPVAPAGAGLAPRAEAVRAPRPVVAPPRAGERVAVGAGTFASGSVPGAQFRDPSVEADGIDVALPAFEIDRLPYPNDPDAPQRTDVSRAEAATLCAEADGRLCDELEWERACGDVYPGGEPFDIERCTLDAAACATPPGLLSMGITAGEWTASDRTTGTAGAVVRGGGALADAGLHRCASRRAVQEEVRSPQVGFRCCHGAPPRVAYPLPDRTAAPFEERAIDDATQRAILASVPEVARFATDFAPFTTRQSTHVQGLALRTVPDAGVGAPLDPRVYTPSGFAIAQHPVVWAPGPGDEAWILSGTSQGVTLIAVVYPLPGGRFRHAASFVLAGETAPVAIGYRDDRRDELLWSSCWGCGGEGGAITRKDDATIVVTQR